RSGAAGIDRQGQNIAANHPAAPKPPARKPNASNRTAKRTRKKPPTKISRAIDIDAGTKS
ncbi:MAG: hypothetical protein OXF57_11790, partial [Rhodospirillaceae bacterium]|nr:hypothetical protein [Rhodospirillaceae bacterium]